MQDPGDAEILRRIVAELAKQPVPKPWHAIELGCGEGAFARELHAAGFLCTAIDLVRDRRWHAEPGLRFAIADLRRLVMREASWTACTAIDVLQFLARQEVFATLERMWRALRPGGVLAVRCFGVSDPAHHVARQRGYLEIDRNSYRVPARDGFLTFLELDELTAWADRRGADILWDESGIIVDDHGPSGQHVHESVTLVLSRRTLE